MTVLYSLDYEQNILKRSLGVLRYKQMLKSRLEYTALTLKESLGVNDNSKEVLYPKNNVLETKRVL